MNLALRSVRDFYDCAAKAAELAEGTAVPRDGVNLRGVLTHVEL